MKAGLVFILIKQPDIIAQLPKMFFIVPYQFDSADREESKQLPEGSLFEAIRVTSQRRLYGLCQRCFTTALPHGESLKV
jgi:hypothetical protein